MNDLPDDANDQFSDGDELDLQNLWQKTPPVNVDSLVKSVKKAQRRMRLFVYYELASTLLGLVLFVLMIKQKWFGDQLWIPIVLGVVVVTGQLWTVTWRRGLWNAFAKSPGELLQLKRRHLLLDIKIARSIYGGLLGGALLGAVVSYFDTGERNLELSDMARGSILTTVIFALFAFLVWGIRKEIRARKQLKELEKQIKEYESVENL